MEAIVEGTGQGLRLLLNIVSMLIVFVALVALANAILGLIPEIAGAPLTLERMLGWVMMPFAWLIGIPWAEAAVAGELLGTKIILNELVTYIRLAELPVDALSERSRVILVYALCSFANIGSVGIMIAGFTVIAPDRRSEVIALSPRALIGGTIATLMTGAVVAILI